MMENIREIIPSFDVLSEAVQFCITMTGLDGVYETSNIKHYESSNICFKKSLVMPHMHV